MTLTFKIYYAGLSLLHKVDARVKIVLLVLATAGVFLVQSLPGIISCLSALIVLIAVARIPLRAYAPFFPAACIFALFPIIFNGLSFDVYAAQETLLTYYGIPYDAFCSFDPIVLVGTFGIVPAGVVRGAVMGLRIFILMYAGILFTFTTQANDVVRAIDWFLSPLARMGVPVRDISLVFSLVLRFIPLIAQEFSLVANAHRCRGSRLDDGSVFQRIKAWGNVFIPLFVRLFRRAEVMGTAMDARCYGATKHAEDGKR